MPVQSSAKNISLPTGVQKSYEETLKSVEARDIEDFRKKIVHLRNDIYRLGLYSVNSFVERVNAKSASFDRDSRIEYVRVALQISPLNAKYWLYLALTDIFSLRLFDFTGDIANLFSAAGNNPVALLKSVFVIYGFVVFALLFFTMFYALAIIFKYLPVFSDDLMRFEPLKGIKSIAEPLLLISIFFSTLLLGSPFSVLLFWLAFFSIYMINREIVTTLVIAGALVSVISLGGRVDSYSNLAIFPSQKNLLHLTYGIVDDVRDIDVNMDGNSPLHLAGKGRIDFSKGAYKSSRKIFSQLESRYGKEFGFFIAASKHYSGDGKGAISKLEELKEHGLDDPALSFNLYQAYMGNYRFEDASLIRSRSWGDLERKRPFNIEPSEIEEFVLIPPSISVRFLLTTLKPQKETGEKILPFYNLWKNPFFDSKLFIIALALIIVLFRVITLNRYLTFSCRVCGDRQLIKVRFKKENLCQICKSKSLLVKATSDKTNKVMSVRFHKFKVRLKSIIVPGFGFISIGAVTSYVIVNLIISILLSIFMLLYLAFPGEYSPLYSLIARLGGGFVGVSLVAVYIVVLVLNDFTLRRVYRKYKIEGA